MVPLDLAYPAKDQMARSSCPGIALLLMLCLLSACTPLATKPPPSTPTAAIADNTDLSSWQLSGKIGLRLKYSEAAQATGIYTNQSNSGLINWRQCDERYHITLSSPFGQRVMELHGDPSYAELVIRKQHYQGVSAEQLLQTHLGWTLPIKELPWWLRGQPAPDQPVNVNPADENGFQQDVWSLSYPRIQTVGDYQLPAKMTAKRPAADDHTPPIPNVSVTLVIKQWQLQPYCQT